ncbi:hypothetical protein [Pseudoalteromonas sp. MMG005]|uniref:hypothetical protein n=1 Tax=Pseudoalteromonas sp. MMG005 TaxID=2822682 RepID=UPI001FFCFDEC|nr:hypothetical protein [Pseudoalteromonas sp. MMG005]
MIGALLGAGPAMPAMPNPIAGLGGLGPINGSSSAATGDQKQSIGFNAQGVSFGSDSNNTLLIVGVVVVAALFLLKK